MDIASVTFCAVMGFALFGTIISIVGIAHMLWEDISRWRRRKAWEAWKRAHADLFIEYPSKPLAWGKYKNRKI